MSARVMALVASVVLAVLLVSCGSRPQSARDVLARCMAAHGGERLTSWRTFTVTGTVRLVDGVAFDAAYLLHAEKPDRLHIERDSTVAGGRLFEETFLNGEVAWRRRNLMPRPAEVAEVRRLLDACDGVARWVERADEATLVGEGEVAWRPATSDDEAVAAIAPRPAYLLTVGSGDELAELAIDRETFHLLRETRGDTTRIFADFRPFGGVAWPTRVVEIVAGPQGERITPYAYTSVVYNEPIQDWLFTEDMPRAPLQ